MASFGKPVQSQRGYELLRRQLVTGRIAPGTRLTEVEWARRLELHRPALREAMRVLAHEGLLEAGERGGFFVPVLSEDDLREIMETRALIETGVIRRLTCDGELDPESCQRLTAICDLMEQLLEEELEYGFVEADRRFHKTLVSLSGNSKLIALYNQAPLPIRLLSAPDPQTRHEKHLQTLTDHRQLVELLEQGRSHEAVALLEQHLHVACTHMTLAY